ncbi:N-acetylmuramic acid 6-phosphate etherase [Microbacterium karelineae]|uniref:N-acetylmuramic acid 6-phosphate etherase n=1 Tax=Microbacterium karelineae TaxID=2654283 RepID=UPI0012E9F3F1|nr:N-acetylmuramic acid 6-phosphate etherase [Microbacterium karelineae]
MAADRTSPSRPRAEAPPLPPTEARLEASRDLDVLPTRDVLATLHTQDRIAVEAVAPALDRLADLVDEAASRFRRGGRIHYFGAGTSGRLGVLDAAELLPTFDLEPGRVVAHIAGGSAGVARAVEDAEDSLDEGAREAADLTAGDVAIGLTASGTTPYVRAALEAARERGAATALVTSNPASPLAGLADYEIVTDTGPEVVTGSTRLKAGTAEKLVLNGFSTALMIAVGRTWSNLMVSVVATNRKLRERSVRILCEATGVEADEAAVTLHDADGEVKTAIVMSFAAVDAHEARRLLAERGGSVREAMRG